MTSPPVRVAMILADDRDETRQWSLPQPFFGTAPTALLEGMAGLPGLELHVVSCERQPVAPLKMLAENIHFHPVRISRWGYLRSIYLEATWRIRRVLRKIQPQLVHGQGTERYQALTSVFSGFPNVLTIHGNMRAVARALHAGPLSFLAFAARFEALALRRTAGVVCLSSYTQREVRPLAPRTWIVPNAVSSPFFDIPGKSGGPLTILCVGRICLYKNQNALIKALDPYAKTTSFRLRFAGGVGGDEFGQEFLKLVAERPWCEHVGFLTRAQLQSELAGTDLLAHPSLEDNCPMVILEAMAAGIPVTAFTIGGIPDLVEHERTGYLCAPDRMDEFCARSMSVLTDRELARRLGEAARASANERFRPVVAARQHLEIYRELVSRPTA